MAERTPIPTTPVKSSNIRSIGYFGGVMQVEFTNGRSYQYDGVTPEEYQALVKADADPEQSVGKVFHGGVRKNYKGVPLEAVKK